MSARARVTMSLVRLSLAWIVVPAAIAAGGASAQDAKAVVAAAAKAMGADVLNTIEFSATGSDFVLGQAYAPDAPWPRFINKSFTRVVDFRVPASRVDRVRIQGEDPPRGGGQQPLRGEQSQSQTVIITASTPWVQQLDLWMSPHGFLKGAATNNASVGTKTVGGKKYTVVSFMGQNKSPVSGFISEQNLVERVETHIDNAMLGDLLFEAVYSDYKDFGGVKVPMHMVQRQGGFPIFDLTLTDVKPNAQVTIQPAPGPGNAPAAPAPPPGQAGPVPSKRLADGVYLILGGYACLAVDFKDYIVVIEGPQSEERALAVIAEAKRLIPGKPIRYVVNTHHHFDHASGLRTFVAEGATVVTQQINKPYYEKTFAAPHTLNPDKLAESKKKATFETVAEKKVMTDGDHVIELYHLQGSGHNAGLVVAYLRKEKILVEADSYNPPAQPNAPTPSPLSPYTTNLVDNIDRLKLDVATIIPIHYAADGRTVTSAELMKAVGR
jgi:glyoxylase-like metal-dependent hydrolase (beta-lactamase superfamily II)